MTYKTLNNDNSVRSSWLHYEGNINEESNLSGETSPSAFTKMKKLVENLGFGGN